MTTMRSALDPDAIHAERVGRSFPQPQPGFVLNDRYIADIWLDRREWWQDVAEAWLREASDLIGDDDARATEAVVAAQDALAASRLFQTSAWARAATS